jgi:hypothetical protein
MLFVSTNYCAAPTEPTIAAAAAAAGGEADTKRERKTAAAAPAVAPKAPRKMKVKPLSVLAAEQLAATLDPKKLNAAVEALTAVWLEPSLENDFEACLHRSDEVINTLFPQLKAIEQPSFLKERDALTLPLLRLFLRNEGIMQRLCSLPLFASIGTWPAPVMGGTSVTFAASGHIAADANNALYVFNSTDHTIKTIPQPPLGEYDYVSLSFSYDASIIARIIRARYNGSITLFDTTTGMQLHLAAITIAGAKMSPNAPLCVYVDNHYNAVVYDYVAKTTASYPTLRPAEMSLQHSDVELSSNATFSAYILTTAPYAYAGPAAPGNLYLQDNDTQQRYILLERASIPNLYSPFPSMIKFNDQETMVAVYDTREGMVKIFNLKDLKPTERVQIPYRVAPSSDRFSFSPNGTQLYVQPTAGPSRIMDLATGTTLETFRPGQEASFLSQNTLELTLPNGAKLYLRDLRQTIDLLPRPLEVNSYLYFSKKSKHCVYKTKLVDGEYLCMFNAKKQLGCAILRLQGPSFNYIYSFDAQGTLRYTYKTDIRQLMLDPTNCTLYQIFFLLGVAKETPNKKPTRSGAQLHKSPLLTTFSAPLQKMLVKAAGFVPAIKAGSLPAPAKKPS